jgi:hypothetical protein
MGRQIIFYGQHFIEFYQDQDEKVKHKIQYVLSSSNKLKKYLKNF